MSGANAEIKSTHRLWENCPNWYFNQQDCNNYIRELLLKSPSKLCITFVFYFLVIMFRLRWWLDKKTGIVFNCFTKDQIWACPNECTQNWYSNVENSLCQPRACFLAQNFVYSIESLGDIIFRIFKLKK